MIMGKAKIVSRDEKSLANFLSILSTRHSQIQIPRYGDEERY